MSSSNFSQFLGLSFEIFCRKNVKTIAEVLGFSGVKYKSGAYFNRGNINTPRNQIDLMFDRSDRVKTICEIKYTEAPVGIEVIEQVERKISILKINNNQTVSRVLISAVGATSNLIEDIILTELLRWKI